MTSHNYRFIAAVVLAGATMTSLPLAQGGTPATQGQTPAPAPQPPPPAGGRAGGRGQIPAPTGGRVGGFTQYTRPAAPAEVIQRGKALYESIIEASRLRLRPILMTSFAFILGVLPLVFATGAGANARRALGTGVVGGMLSAAILGVLLAPIFFVAIRRMVGEKLSIPDADRPKVI